MDSCVIVPYISLMSYTSLVQHLIFYMKMNVTSFKVPKNGVRLKFKKTKLTKRDQKFTKTEQKITKNVKERQKIY